MRCRRFLCNERLYDPDRWNTAFRYVTQQIEFTAVEHHQVDEGILLSSLTVTTIRLWLSPNSIASLRNSAGSVMSKPKPEAILFLIRLRTSHYYIGQC